MQYDIPVLRIHLNGRQRLAADDLPGDGILHLFADDTPLTRSTYLLYRRRETELPQVRAFIQTVCELENIPSPVPRV